MAKTSHFSWVLALLGKSISIKCLGKIIRDEAFLFLASSAPPSLTRFLREGWSWARHRGFFLPAGATEPCQNDIALCKASQSPESQWRTRKSKSRAVNCECSTKSMTITSPKPIPTLARGSPCFLKPIWNPRHSQGVLAWFCQQGSMWLSGRFVWGQKWAWTSFRSTTIAQFLAHPLK